MRGVKEGFNIREPAYIANAGNSEPSNSCLSGMCEPRLRVVVIGHTSVSRSRGRARYSRQMLDRTVETHLIVPDRWYENGQWQKVDVPDEMEKRVHVRPIRLPHFSKAKWYLHHYSGLGECVTQLKPDVIHVWEEPWSLVGLQMVLIRNRLFPAVPLVFEVDQNIPKRLPPPFEQIRRYVLANTDYVLARSVDALNVVRMKGYAGEASLINHAVDQTIFKPRERALSRSGHAGNGLAIGYVGRLVPEKGLDDVLDALVRCDSTIRLMVMGDGPHRDCLVERVEHLGLAGRVRLFRWSSPEVVAEFVSHLDVLILMTRTTKIVKEQFGRVIIEAHSCAVPVIGSTCGAIPEVIGAGGWVVPESDPAALAVLLGQLAADAGRLRFAGLAGLKQVQSQFSVDAVATTLINAWRRSIGIRSATAESELSPPKGMPARTTPQRANESGSA